MTWVTLTPPFPSLSLILRLTGGWSWVIHSFLTSPTISLLDGMSYLISSIVSIRHPLHWLPCLHGSGVWSHWWGLGEGDQEMRRQPNKDEKETVVFNSTRGMEGLLSSLI